MIVQHEPRVARHPSLVDQVVEAVFNAVISGELSPGAPLTEEGLAERCAVSCTPAREAMRRLLALGMVAARSGRGLRIAALTADDVREVTGLRAELECLAARLALARLTPEDLADLEAIQRRCEEMLESGSRHLVYLEDSRFHLSFARLSGNRHLEDALRQLEVKVQLCRAFLRHPDEDVRASIRSHRGILDAVERGDRAVALELLREHILGMVAAWRDRET